MPAKTILLSPEGIDEALDFLSSALEGKVNSKKLNQAMLFSEEYMHLLSKAAETPDASATLQVKITFGSVKVNITARGRELEDLVPDPYPIKDLLSLEESAESDTEDRIRSQILRSFGNQVRYRYRRNTSRLTLILQKREISDLACTLIAFALAVILGLTLRFFGVEGFNAALCSNFFDPIKDTYLRAMGIIVGPVVFFSLATSVSQYTDISSLGRIGGKVLGIYIFTSVAAVFAGIGIFFLVDPGSAGSMALAGTTVAENNADISIVSIFTNIVPSDIFSPFVNGDMLQILFLSILIGIVSGTLGKHSQTFQEFFDACNELFLKITMIFAKLIPLIIFCSITELLIQTGGEVILNLGILTLTILVGYLSMMVLYSLLILVVGRLNPLHLFRKFGPTAAQIFSLASSSASMPLTMNFCRDKLGIQKKVYAFSIPLGSAITMDGFIVFLTISMFFMTKLYGIALPAGQWVPILVTIALIAMGTPGVPGAGLMSMLCLFSMAGVPAEALTMLLPVSALVEMPETVSNVTSGISATLIVAKTEKLMDLDVYRS